MLDGSAEAAEQRGQQRRNGNADLEALEVFDAVELPARRRSDLPETIVPDFLHRHDPGLADGIADDIADAAIHRGPDLIVGLECEANARQARQWHQGRQGHAGRRQQIDSTGAKLRQHFGVAAKLAVGENRDIQPAGRLRADGMSGLRQSKRKRMGIGRVDAQFELELGSGACGLAEDGRCPGGRSSAEPFPAGYFHFCCLPSALPRFFSPERFTAPACSFRRTAVLCKVRG